MISTRLVRWCSLIGAAATLAAPATASAFCGFYVGGADAKLFNNATSVVLMREGTRTVLSMQNNYQGPPTGFALVVPVPVVLQEENVKTLPREVFEVVDQLGAPRLVEYWERDPCASEIEGELRKSTGVQLSSSRKQKSSSEPLGVTIEAQFTVGEYQIVILSASDSMGLDTWLRQEKYAIPEGSEPLLRPYVEEGMKFFVAKVDPKKVKFDAQGQATLSPLRFHYDSREFRLPVRLGMINSAGTQDLLINILARGQRYEAANYPNTTIPTNIDLAPEAKARFGEFYAALFDKTLEQRPGAVVTEYAWDASTCDPCPGPTLTGADEMTLGADVLDGSGGLGGAPPPGRSLRRGGGFVLTRLHARYGKGALAEDLVFREAPPLVGGREWMMGEKLEKGGRVDSGSRNNFQGRYAIRHRWAGEVRCENPVYGRWGGPPGSYESKPRPTAAQALAFAARGQIELARMVKEDVPELGLMVASSAGAVNQAVVMADELPRPAVEQPAAVEVKPVEAAAPPEAKTVSGCGCRAEAGSGAGAGLWGLLGLAGLGRRRRKGNQNP